MKRLDALLSRTHLARSEAKKLITSGKVTVNGIIVKNPSEHIDETAVIISEGKRLDCSEFIYIMMNKKAGYICSAAEEPSVLSLLPEEFGKKGISTVGRLDKDTEGLLILTNDGGFSHRITAPSKKIFKRYYAELEKPVSENDIGAFAAGLRDGKDSFLPSELSLCGEKAATVMICEGKYHQVKRMFGAVGNEVLYLKRLSIGRLSLDESLDEGESRRLTEEEMKLIFE